MNMREPLHNTPRDEVLEALFSHARARTRAPLETEQDVRRTLHAEWQTLTRRRRRRTGIALAAAAALLLTIGVGTVLREPGTPVVSVNTLASVERQSGDILVRRAGDAAAASRRLASARLTAGQVLETTPGARLAITWSGGESVRMDEGTTIRLVSAGAIELTQGRVYMATAAGGGGDSELLVRTPAGVVQHLGTQYMVSMFDATLAVSVREGRVSVSHAGKQSLADPGQQLTISPSGQAAVAAIAPFGELWAWTELVTPEYVLDGRSAFEFIDWVSRETGRAVTYATADAEQRARSTMLRGNVTLEPMRALELILQTSDLVPAIRDGHIVIRLTPEP